jgi:demethylmenaquinone methyltransferase/2-methoxy-6-polyprenyl-1,4-benzoquinol methylase
MTDVSKAPHKIASMFDAIAGRYDFLNHLLSAGIDRRWRARAIASLHLTGSERVLDVCTGTGDLAIAAARGRPPAARVVGVDFSAAMLRVAHAKLAGSPVANGVRVVQGDATRLPISDGSVDAVTIAFGIRNVDDVAAACAEMRRVLRPRGRLAVLEFAVPTTPGISAAYLWYLNHVLPRVGRALSRHDDAYGYLPASIGAFTSPDDFVKVLQGSGFAAVQAVPLTFGSVVLYVGERAEDR